MTGRITTLIGTQQFASIATDDGAVYVFEAGTLVNPRFADLSIGVAVSFEPAVAAGSGRATAVRVLRS